jgi:NADPH:quinone reductase-like Zn-dependent oxidoreductase
VRAWVLREIGDPDRYRLEDVPTPEPGDGEVRVRLRASALNHLDLWVARGLPEPILPHVPGADGAGIVDAVGPGVEHPAVGDEVVVDPSTSCGRCQACEAGDVPFCRAFRILGEHRWGTLAERVVVPAVNAVPRPANLSWPQSAAFGLVTSSAVRMLRRARLEPGETMLVVGVGGGVSSAGLLVGLARGARVLVTSTSPEKIGWALSAGADAGFDSRGTFSEEVRKATDGRGVDVVFENVGPATWEQSMRSLARGGRLVTNGGTTGRTAELNLPFLFWRQLEVIGATMNDHDEFRQAVELVRDGRVEIPVDSVLGFDELPEALARLKEGARLGKIVLAQAG